MYHKLCHNITTQYAATNFFYPYSLWVCLFYHARYTYGVLLYLEKKNFQFSRFFNMVCSINVYKPVTSRAQHVLISEEVLHSSPTHKSCLPTSHSMLEGSSRILTFYPLPHVLNVNSFPRLCVFGNPVQDSVKKLLNESLLRFSSRRSHWSNIYLKSQSSMVNYQTILYHKIQAANSISICIVSEIVKIFNMF